MQPVYPSSCRQLVARHMGSRRDRSVLLVPWTAYALFHELFIILALLFQSAYASGYACASSNKKDELIGLIAFADHDTFLPSILVFIVWGSFE